MSTDATLEAVSAPDTDYRFTFEPYGRRITATFNGTVVADSNEVMVLHETRLAPTYYFPRKHVRMDLMQASPRRTHCPFKGNASYWSIQVGDRSVENAIWSYEDPIAEGAAITNYVAFYTRLLDDWREDGKAAVDEEPAPSTSFGNPLLPWLMTTAPHVSGARTLTQSLSQEMVDQGIPVWRLFVMIRTLHPQLMAMSYRWWRKSEDVEVFRAPYELMQQPQFLNSPFIPILDGAGGIRRRLDGPEPPLDYPILADLHAEGATDYAAMPMLFSDGQINVITLASAEPGGFSTSDLGHLYEILPLLGRLYEVHAMRYRASTLLDTYLGHHAASRVLEGRIKRGDGEDIEAVIWFCDLRDSTPLAQSLPRDEFLDMLNVYFDCMAGTVLEHGGQVLRFIGDAALAIFPIGTEVSSDDARQRALRAAGDAWQRMDAINAQRRVDGKRELGFGIALHQGQVTYGNIGTANRLEFTVIGDAANRAARIESMCKQLGKPVLVSGDVARAAPERFEDLGEFPLRGVSEPIRLFALRL
jgi:adenylate cyclase